MKTQEIAALDRKRIQAILAVVERTEIPEETEGQSKGPGSGIEIKLLANAYLAIVAICHQTSPAGERQTHGTVNAQLLRGWDYLKAKFLNSVARNPSLAEFDCWASLNPNTLSEIFRDPDTGLTLNRINERAYLLNNLAENMLSLKIKDINQGFTKSKAMLFGEKGFLNLLAQSEAYSDPLMKKSSFFVSIAMSECGWEPTDRTELLSPIDYHELRGHLRLGTIVVRDVKLQEKVSSGIPVTVDEDIALRRAAQQANNLIAEGIGIENSRLHYLLWNLFRACCPRDSKKTHCSSCSSDCQLPNAYKEMKSYKNKCIFSDVCMSAGAENKLVEPAYLGHFY